MSWNKMYIIYIKISNRWTYRLRITVLSYILLQLSNCRGIIFSWRCPAVKKLGIRTFVIPYRFRSLTSKSQCVVCGCRRNLLLESVDTTGSQRKQLQQLWWVFVTNTVGGPRDVSVLVKIVSANTPGLRNDRWRFGLRAAGTIQERR